MATILRTSDGDILDTLCNGYYGHLDGTVEAVLLANPGLADEPQPLRAGVLIELPELQQASKDVIQLWS